MGYKLRLHKKQRRMNSDECERQLHIMFVSELVENLCCTGKMRIRSNRFSRCNESGRDNLWKAVKTGWRPDPELVGVIISNHRNDGLCEYT